MDLRPREDDVLPPPVQLSQALQPLLSTRFLEYMSLTTSLAVTHLDDRWLECAARAWPRLKHSQLVGEYHWITQSITLGGLLPLLRHCPSRASIDLRFYNKPFCRSLLEGIVNNYKVLFLNSSRPHIRPEDSIVKPGLVAQWVESISTALFGMRPRDDLDEGVPDDVDEEQLGWHQREFKNS